MEDFRRDCNITDSSSAETESIGESPRWILATKKESSVRGGSPESIVVDADLAKQVMSHQKEGVEFIWRNCFSDWDNAGEKNGAGGCIVAHEMGLGKSLTTITLLHTVMNNPCLPESKTSEMKHPVRSVLILAPTNVIPNWEKEIEQWTEELENPISLFNLQSTNSHSRKGESMKWKKRGGVLLMSDDLFRRHFSSFIIKEAPPDILVLDEAHTMLKHSKTKISKLLCQLSTKRRILLTGTPMQNNATEFYQLVNFVRPGIIPGISSDAAFEAEYRKPIESGLPQDASDESNELSQKKQLKLNTIVEPFLHRRTKDVLKDKLPKSFDVLLTLQQSVCQQHILKAYERYCRVTGRNNFFRRYQLLSPVLNHPTGLKSKAEKAEKVSKRARMDNSRIDINADESNLAKEILGTLQNSTLEKLHEARNSPKIIILAHILGMAFQRGEKVLVYSKCLITLGLITKFLESKDWKKEIGSLAAKFPHDRLGGLRKGKDFVRIDGSIESGKRGVLVEQFNSTDSIMVFLISAEAGGIGINLTSASRVVIMDNHFNPSVSDQCVARAHRFGQQKQVYCYRLAIEGTLETKVYARGVNKSGVASGVVEGVPLEQCFDRSELENLEKTDYKVTCCLCGKKRLLDPDKDPPEDDEEWECTQIGDSYTCSVLADDTNSSCNRTGIQDVILEHLVGVVNHRTRKSPLVVAWSPVHNSKATSRKVNEKQNKQQVIAGDELSCHGIQVHNKKRERREGNANGSHTKRHMMGFIQDD